MARQSTVDFDTEDDIFLSPAPAPPEPPNTQKIQVDCETGPDYSSSVPMAGLPLAGAMMGLCLGGPVSRYQPISSLHSLY